MHYLSGTTEKQLYIAGAPVEKKILNMCMYVYLNSYCYCKALTLNELASKSKADNTNIKKC